MKPIVRFSTSLNLVLLMTLASFAQVKGDEPGDWDCSCACGAEECMSKLWCDDIDSGESWELPLEGLSEEQACLQLITTCELAQKQHDYCGTFN